MIVVGIDPGLDGAIAFWDTAQHLLVIHDMPTLRLRSGKSEKRRVDQTALAHIMDRNAETVRAGFVEAVGPMPKQGVTSSFNFGKSAGIAEMALAAHFIPLTLVPPPVWKRHFGIKAGAGKDASRAKASQLLPQFAPTWNRARDDGRAEAVLIALYGAAQRTPPQNAP